MKKILVNFSSTTLYNYSSLLLIMYSNKLLFSQYSLFYVYF